jgi:hypothetical protein
MRAEEGDESIKDYAKEARDAQGKVGGPHLTLPRKLLRFLGFGQGDAGSEQGGHR